MFIFNSLNAIQLNVPCLPLFKFFFELFDLRNVISLYTTPKRKKTFPRIILEINIKHFYIDLWKREERTSNLLVLKE